MRFLCFMIPLIALFVLASSKECKDTCPNEFDVHCATDGSCYFTALNACAAQLQSCYREKRGLSAYTSINRGYCNWGVPRCKTYKD